MYNKQLEEVMIKTDDGIKLVPELYSVASKDVSAEYAEPGSQSRIALGRCPFMWAQSLYILGKLLQEVSNIFRNVIKMQIFLNKKKLPYLKEHYIYFFVTYIC